MANIVIIDDDFSIGILGENLRYRGHNVRIIDSADEALKQLDAIVSADIIILDIIMKYPDQFMNNGVSDGRSTGMIIFKELRKRTPDVPIFVYSAIQDKNLIDIFSNDKNTKFLPKWKAPRLFEVVNIVERLSSVGTIHSEPNAFIVHGHDDDAKLELKNYLQNVLELPEPIILHEQPNLGRTIIEKFEDYAMQSNLVFILLTPDDLMAKGEETDDEKRRARQNVILELGYFLGVLGRETGRVILLHKGPLDVPSDLSGVVYIDISNGIEAAGENIRKELKDVLA